MGILNLTDVDMTLILEERMPAKVVPASGYVARVEISRKAVAAFDFPYRLEIECGTYSFPIYEETPTEIIFDVPPEKRETWGLDHPLDELKSQLNENPSLLVLVTREVAEAAATLKHPLWRRMVFVGLGEYTGTHDDESIGYRALRRVPQGGAK